MTNFDRIKQMSEDEFIKWVEDYAEDYTTFWIAPADMCDFSHRESDKRMLRDLLRSEYSDSDKEIMF